MADFTVGAGVGGAGRPASIIERRDGQFLGTTNSLPLAIPSPPLGRGGTLFAMDAAGVRTTLHTFVVALLGDVFGTPMGNLFEGTDGTVYGTTYSLNDSFIPPGEVFKISPGGVYTRLALSNSLRAGVIQARDGNLYGVTEGNFVDIALRFPGKVFRVEANGTLTTVHAFQIDGDSFNPVGELVEIDDGSLYGTTAGGPLSLVGPNPTQIPGVIFRVDPTTGAYAVRYRFPERVVPVGRLIQGTDGLIYGTTTNGGASGLGTVFSLDAAGTLTTLHEFTGADGATPQAGVIQGSDGRLFGTTRDGGAFGHGTVFAMTVTGEFTTLHDFAMSDGANPIEELFQAHDGALYGTARNGGPLGGGVVFRVTLGTTTPPPANGYVEIVSRSSGKCLDVFGASTDPAAPVIQWVCTGGLNQQWLLEPVAGGAFRVTARHSGQALDVFGALTDDVTPLIQFPPTGGANQAWTLQPTSDGYVTFIAGHSGKAMDVEFASTDDGARVIQYSPTGGLNQQWLLRPVP